MEYEVYVSYYIKLIVYCENLRQELALPLGIMSQLSQILDAEEGTKY